MLGLRDQVRRRARDIGGVVRDHDRLRRPRDLIDIDLPVRHTASPRSQTELPGPTILSTRGTVSVPYAIAAIACAPPIVKTMDRPRDRGSGENHIGDARRMRRRRDNDLPHTGHARRDRRHQQ